MQDVKYWTNWGRGGQLHGNFLYAIFKKMFAARKSKQAFLDSVDSKLIKP